MIWKALTIILLALAIFGGGSYYTYQLFFQPKQELKQEVETVAVPTPTPDPSLAVYEEVAALRGTRDLAEVRDAYRAFLEQYPDSPKAAQAKEELGDVGMDIFLTPTPSPEKAVYVVVKGDALVKVAKKTGVEAELIMRANNLPNINLRIDQQLLIPQIKPSLKVDRTAKTVTLLDDGKFVKEYKLLVLHALQPGEGTVTEKIATRDGKRVAFGSKEYAQSDRSILTSLGGWVIFGSGIPSADTEADAAPSGGTVMKQGDIEELFLFVGRGTPIVIE